ncbi:MAG: PLP-dependent transferase [Pseudomonadota bacterium]
MLNTTDNTATSAQDQIAAWGKVRAEQATLLAQLDHFVDANTGAVIPPIHPATTYARGADYALPGHGGTYARDEDPTVKQVEKILAKLEAGRDSQAEAMLFASGMAGITSLIRSVVAVAGQEGRQARLIIQKSMYFGTVKLLEHLRASHTAQVEWFDPAIPDSMAALTAQPADLVWIETPSNPYLYLLDIQATADLAHQAGALLAVDSTVAPPVLGRPLDYGADLVFHSATKALNGHSDVLAGLVVTRQVTHPVWQALSVERKLGGAVLNSFGAWLLARGLRTLMLRMDRSVATAQTVAEALAQHPKVHRVNYPGLTHHPDFDLAQRQMPGGAGALLSFHVDGGSQAALTLIGQLKLIIPATSLGGPETLIEHRHTIEGPDYGAAEDLLRLSVGLEDPLHLIQDLQQALD